MKNYVKEKSWKRLVLISFCIQVTLLFYQGNTFKSIINKVDDKEILTFREFYSEDLFNQIELNLRQREEGPFKVACLGFYPGIAAFNGMSTLGGYFTLYPLEKKDEFYQIIDEETQKNQEVDDYYTNWGSRSYIFDDEIGLDFLCTKDKNLSTEKIDLDFDLLNEKNVRYLLSAVEVINVDTSNMSLIRVYVNEVWSIEVYEILP